MKKILVTGSGGFIFSNFIRKSLFNKSEYSFVSIDVCKGTNVLNNVYANKGHKLYIGDVADKHFVNVVFELERPDIVIHGAANSSGDPKELINSNILGTQIIVEACQNWMVDKLLYISTDEVYPPDLNFSATEDISPDPKNIFAATKLTGELLIKISPINYSILRLGKSYGPRQQTHNFIPAAIRSIFNNKELTLLGNSNQTQEWTYVEDIYTGIMAVLEKGEDRQTYNISSGYEFSYLEVFQEICNIFERGYELIKFVEHSAIHSHKYSTDANKLKSLGWKPNFKLKNGLYQTCSWYEKNLWFLRTS